MTELEKAEKLREKTGVSYTEAKEALDHAGGDLLDALIYLENHGKAVAPPGGGFFSGVSGSGSDQQSSNRNCNEQNNDYMGFSAILARFGRFCLKVLHKGNTNYLEARKGSEHLFSCPVTVLVLLLIFFFWITLPVLVITLFFGFRYRFSGPDLGVQSVNNAMDGASDVVEDVKKSFASGTDH